MPYLGISVPNHTRTSYGVEESPLTGTPKHHISATPQILGQRR